MSTPGDSDRRHGRRDVLRGLSAALLGVAGVGSIGSAAAQSGEDVTTVDLRESDDQSLPVADELLVFLHGWNGSSVGPSQAADVAGILADGGYEPDETVALVYQADAVDQQGALEQAGRAADELAPLVQEFYDDGGGSLRLTGHSLGGRVILATPDRLEDGYVVDTIAPMGAAADGSTVVEGGPWYGGLAERAAAVRNYHSRDDSVILGDFGAGDDTALGAEGAPDAAATPDTYTDVDVTEDVSNHGGYTSSSLIGQDLAAAIAEQDGGEETPCRAVDAANEAQVDGQYVCDLGGDEHFRDVNADGRVGNRDVGAFFERFHLDAWDREEFDYSGNGRVSHGDVVTLFDYVL